MAFGNVQGGMLGWSEVGKKGPKIKFLDQKNKTEESLIPKRHSRRRAKIGFKEILGVLGQKPNHKT